MIARPQARKVYQRWGGTIYTWLKGYRVPTLLVVRLLLNRRMTHLTTLLCFIRHAQLFSSLHIYQP
jgi:hypothetical protein